MAHPHKDTPESFWERMRLIHGPDIHGPQSTSEPDESKGHQDGNTPFERVPTDQDEIGDEASGTS